LRVRKYKQKAEPRPYWFGFFLYIAPDVFLAFFGFIRQRRTSAPAVLPLPYYRFCALVFALSSCIVLTKNIPLDMRVLRISGKIASALYQFSFCALLFCLLGGGVAYAQSADPAPILSDKVQKKALDSARKASRETILQKPPTSFTPRQILIADTLSKPQNADSTLIGTTAPGEYPFTPEQDRAFFEAMRLDVPPRTRFQFETRQFSAAWMAAMEARKYSPQEAAIAAMNSIDPRAFQPTPQEQTFYNYGIAQSFTIPGVFDPFARYGGLPGVGGSGVSIPLSLIGSLLGLTEDLSPTIRYTVPQPSEVDITIYSIQAIGIARILKAEQGAGGYSVTWNLLNDNGLRVPPGDYVAEVRIGISDFVRKRIRVN
jgi:hypothetical protein